MFKPWRQNGSQLLPDYFNNQLKYPPDNFFQLYLFQLAAQNAQLDRRKWNA
jgi:hypothetical protein